MNRHLKVNQRRARLARRSLHEASGLKRVALVYDWVDKWGGAEQLLLSLHRIFPEAPLFTSVYHKEKAPWAKKFKVIPSWLDRLLWPRDHEQLFPLIPMAFESFDFSDFDLVISVSSAFAKGVITKPGTLHICYCLAPTRFLWGEKDLYEKRVSTFLKFMTKPIFSYLQSWDKIAASRPDSLVTISNYVGEGIFKYYGRKVERVIYPSLPQMTGFQKTTSGKREYFLVVSRLVPYKKVELAIKAFQQLNYPLRIVGTGVEEPYLRRVASANVEFMGEVSEDVKRSLYEGAIAVIVPQKEDFGLVSLEAAACGTPVVAFAGGGNLETVKNGISGIFFSEQTPDSLVKVIKETDFTNFSPARCRKHARSFSFRRFQNQWEELLTGLPE